MEKIFEFDFLQVEIYSRLSRTILLKHAHEDTENHVPNSKIKCLKR
jgi:hypothetical protein